MQAPPCGHKQRVTTTEVEGCRLAQMRASWRRQLLRPIGFEAITSRDVLHVVGRDVATPVVSVHADTVKRVRSTAYYSPPQRPSIFLSLHFPFLPLHLAFDFGLGSRTRLSARGVTRPRSHLRQESPLPLPRSSAPRRTRPANRDFGARADPLPAHGPGRRPLLVRRTRASCAATGTG